MAIRHRKHSEVVDLLRAHTEARRAVAQAEVDKGREELKRRESESDGETGG